jgi:outer membrane protein insertion porin family
MFANFFIIFLIVLLPVASLGQVARDSAVVKIRWAAEGEIKASDLRQLDGLSKNRLLRATEIETIIRRVLGGLQQRGFYFAQVDTVTVAWPKRSTAPEATVHLDSKPQVRFVPIAKFADSTAALLENRSALRGKFDEATLQERLLAILENFAQKGYPLAQFNLDSLELTIHEQKSEALATLHFQFAAGPLVRIDSIAIRGNKLTKRSVLARSIPIRAGERFNFDKVQSIPERFMRLGYLQVVALPQFGIDACGCYLLDVAVTEGNSNLFNGVAGYNPGTQGQKGYFTGMLEVKFGNLFGTGRQVNARLEKRSRETQEIALLYREPWVAGYPVHLSGGFQQRIQDTSYVERRWDLTAEVPVGNFVFSGSFLRENVSPDSLARVNSGLVPSRTTSFGAGLRFDSTDDPINPQHGVFYLTAVETGRKNVEAIDTVEAKQFSRDKIFIDFHWLLPILKSQVFSLALHGREVKSNQPIIPLPDQFRLGGATTLRGYREEQFRGTRVAWSNLEYRYLLSRRSRAVLFFDAGYFYRLEGPLPNLQKIEDTKLSWGLGVRVDTPLGIIGVDYGLGEGDALTNGKVHVSLVNSF